MDGKFELLGIKIDDITLPQTINRIKDFFNDGKQHQIVTVNSEFLVKVRQDKEFRRILQSADLCLPDGAGILLARNFLNKRKLPKKNLSERTTGIDLILRMVQELNKSEISLFLFGGTQDVVSKAVFNLKKQFPGIKIAGFYSGLMVDSEKIKEKIRKTKPNILLVGMGAPLQEKWIYHNLKDLPSVKIAIGVGGSFDFISGRIKRAPLFFRNNGLEWLWRFLRQPQRLVRILRATIFFPYLILKEEILKK